MENPEHKYLKCTLEVFLILSALVLIGVMIWGIDKGFDPTDEGYNLLGLDPGQEKSSTFSALQFTLLSRVFGWLNGVIPYRVLSIVFTTVGALIFSWGFLKILRRLYPGRVVLSGWAIGAWFLGASFFFNVSLSLTFSYNVLINTWMLLTGGLVFYALAIHDLDRLRVRLAWGGVGVALGIALFVKPTATAELSLLYLAGMFLFAPRRWKTALRDGVAPLVGGGLLALLLAVGLGVVGPIVDTLRNGVVLHPGHQLIDLLRVLRQDAREIVQYLIPYSGLVLGGLACGITFVFVNKYEDRWALRGGLIFTLIFGLAVAVLFPLAHDALFERKLRVPLLGTFIVILLLLIGLTGPALLKRMKPARRAAVDGDQGQKLVVGAILLLLPLATAIGTNNLMQWQLWLHITPWLGLVILLFQETQLSRWTWSVGWLVLAFVAAWVWSEWMVGYLIWPYRLPAFRTFQTEPLNVHSQRFAGLKVDPRTKFYLEGFDEIVFKSKYQPGSGVIALYDMPGMVYLIEGYSPGDPWFMADEGWIDTLIENVRTSRLAKPSYLIVTNQAMAKPVEAYISQGEIDFPDAYRQLERITNPVRNRETTIYERRR